MKLIIAVFKRRQGTSLCTFFCMLTQLKFNMKNCWRLLSGGVREKLWFILRENNSRWEKQILCCCFWFGGARTDEAWKINFYVKLKQTSRLNKNVICRLFYDYTKLFLYFAWFPQNYRVYCCLSTLSLYSDPFLFLETLYGMSEMRCGGGGGNITSQRTFYSINEKCGIELETVIYDFWRSKVMAKDDESEAFAYSRMTFCLAWSIHYNRFARSGLYIYIRRNT